MLQHKFISVSCQSTISSFHLVKVSSNIFISAVKRIQNKSFCLHNICMCTVCIYYVYINVHTYSIYFENIYMYIHSYICIFILYIIYKYLIYKLVLSID